MARGSIFRKDNGWAFRFDAGFAMGSGARRQLLKQGFATKKAAEDALKEAQHQISKGNVVSKSSARLSEFLADWIVAEQAQLRPSTWHSYKGAVAQISAVLGRYPLQSITPLQIEKFYAEMLTSGSKHGTALAPKTVRNAHVVLRKALSDAERLGLVIRNAAAAARPPALVRVEFMTWSSDELRTFFATVANDRLYAAYALLATTGMRRGEVLGLRWSSLDFDGLELAVSQTRTTAGREVVTGPPKTARSRRHIYLDAQTVEVLRQHRTRQRAEKLALGPDWDASNDLVFRDEAGAGLHPDDVSRWFRAIVSTLDVPRIRLHDLRHTYATLALKAGVHPKIVSERLGHSSIAVTLDIYSHVIPSIAREAADVVASRIYGTM